jgi:hypothetical protein
MWKSRRLAVAALLFRAWMATAALPFFRCLSSAKLFFLFRFFFVFVVTLTLSLCVGQALPDTLYKNFESRQQDEALIKADIPGLVRCPGLKA